MEEEELGAAWSARPVGGILQLQAHSGQLKCRPTGATVDLLHSMTVSERLGTDIDWCIVGGESGHHARPMDPLWARSLQQQCHLWEIPFMFKQWFGRSMLSFSCLLPAAHYALRISLQPPG